MKPKCPFCNKELKRTKQYKKIHSHGRKSNAKYLFRELLDICFNNTCPYLKLEHKRYKV